MYKLLRANAARMRKSMIFRGGLAVMMIFALWLTVDHFTQDRQYGGTTPELFAAYIFQSVILNGIVFAVFCSLFTGTEYDDGTIRNKLLVGHSRTNIYLSNLFCSLAAGTLQSLAAIGIVLAVGTALVGMPAIGGWHFCQILILLLFLNTAYISLFNLVAMMVSSKSYITTINILLAFAMLIAAVLLASLLGEPEMINDYNYTADGMLTVGGQIPNPSYVSGIRRIVYQFFFDFLPGGQTLQISNMQIQAGMEEHVARLCLYSAFITAAANGTGIFWFQTKDIK